MGSMVTTPRPAKTLDDLYALPDETRAELIAGEVYVTPAPSAAHQGVVLELAWHMRTAIRGGDGGRVLLSPCDVHLPSGDVVQPDVLFLREAQLDSVDRVVRCAPALIVEVLSRSNLERDRLVKRALYLENGVEEYWIVDPVDRGVEVLLREDEQWRPGGWFVGESVLTTKELPSLSIPVAEIWVP